MYFKINMFENFFIGTIGTLNLYRLLESFIDEDDVGNLECHIHLLDFDVTESVIGANFLLRALEKHALECAGFLLDLGIDPNSKTQHSSLLATLSSTRDDYATEILLLASYGANLDGADDEVAPIDQACIQMPKNNLEMLCKLGAHIEMVSVYPYSTCVHAIHARRYENLEILLKYGAPQNTSEDVWNYVMSLADRCFGTMYVGGWIDDFLPILLPHLGDCKIHPFSVNIFFKCIELGAVHWAWHIIELRCHLQFWHPDHPTGLPYDFAEVLDMGHPEAPALNEIVFGCGEHFWVEESDIRSMHPIAQQYMADQRGTRLFAIALRRVRGILTRANGINLFCLVDKLPLPKALQRALLYQ